LIAAHLKLQPGQERLTSEQEAEARRFAQERIAAQLSTESVDEAEAERLLQQVYAAAGLAAPRAIRWLDGPLQMIPAGASARVWDQMRDSVRDSVRGSVGAGVWDSIKIAVRDRVEEHVLLRVGGSIYRTAQDSVKGRSWNQVGRGLSAGVVAYFEAPSLAVAHFFAAYLAPNALHALAHFNEVVSGYWLGKREALVVRRPRLLARDAEGRLHSETGKCLEYRDGWGFYAWHGVLVPERVILRPETLTRDDFLNEQNVEVRRVMQERMGERFVPELGGTIIDAGSRGTLYEVRLPEDEPERVAHYVQVQDASTERQYYLRVPPSIQTADEAVAWSFGRSVEEYAPARET
jgi:hypothetical protein